MIVRLLAFLIVLAVILDALGMYDLNEAALAKYTVAALALIAWSISLVAKRKPDPWDWKRHRGEAR